MSGHREATNWHLVIVNDCGMLFAHVQYDEGADPGTNHHVSNESCNHIGSCCSSFAWFQLTVAFCKL